MEHGLLNSGIHTCGLLNNGHLYKAQNQVSSWENNESTEQAFCHAMPLAVMGSMVHLRPGTFRA